MELYHQLTSSLDQLFASQLTESVKWTNVPGQLDLISASPSGYTWGIQKLQKAIYWCREPCTGSWTNVELPLNEKTDITTDAQNVFVLTYDGTKANVSIRPVDGTGNWSPPKAAPSGTTRIVAGTGFLWAETPRGNFKLASPFQGEWVGETMPLTMTGPMGGALTAIFNPPKLVRLASASANRVYGISADSKAMFYDNGDWKPLEGLKDHAVSTLSGEMDDRAIYAVAVNGNVLRCEAPCGAGSAVKVLNTGGHAPKPGMPKTLTVSPASKQVWEIAEVPGEKGNLFQRTDALLTTLVPQAMALDAQRDSVVSKIQTDYNTAKAADETSDKFRTTIDHVRSLRPRVPPEETETILKRSIRSITLDTGLRVLQIALTTVFVILGILLVLPDWLSYGLSFVVACAGIVLAVSFSKVHG